MKLNKLLLQYIAVLILTFGVNAIALFGQNSDIPESPKLARLVNDFAGLLNSSEQASLERKLVTFDDSTTTQIAVVIVKSLGGYEIADFSTRLFEKWSIGQKTKNNGLLILVKPKNEEGKGQVWITTGYGIEGVIPDAVAKQIVEREIIPSFKNNKYYEGLDKATSTLMSLARGEFKAENYIGHAKKKRPSGAIWPALIIFIIVIVIIASRNGGNNRHFSSGADIPFWMLLGGILGSSGRGGGDYGDFSSGGGDFGGFDGGSTGGGGAGGSW